MQLVQVIQLLEQYPELLHELSINQIVQFIAICRHTKPRIALQSAAPAVAPDNLPRSVHQFFTAATRASDDAAKLCWIALKTHIWELEPCEANPTEYLPLFLEYGLPLDIGRSRLDEKACI
ncbi:hypothetical protein AURDEDRAFT_176409 [Auricularia subglabra TFB-10046 SS5]|uniref:Uncharacterized protein n=1 Tax=Auricularia subglabra (strain TFB-10046 / SS5) TaxID=717982 RepID=J0D6Q1_AURST|nr:hypothetical protein AURDEDRAFT_176409 [Auricularia subglabra TFB-10046 SS5]